MMRHTARLLGGIAMASLAAGDPAGVDFREQIQPILQANCGGCHGADRIEAGLRLDRRQDAMAGSYYGQYPVIVPGDAVRSELFVRITAADDADAMPPEGARLPPEAVELVRRWIDAGAEWPEAEENRGQGPSRHWAYQVPAPAPIPASSDPFVRGAIDAFVLARLEAEGLHPAGDADPAQWLRRVSLDLTGLPPSLEALDAFLADPSEAAYEAAVDRLLDSPGYGERWARLWLDLARYADTHGYEKDGARSMWRYRDWVIEALQRDLPFDQFTVLQLAGDLLPEPTTEQLIATGFHRNTMLNQEGGVDPEEFRVEAVIDRVSTTADIWLGSTLACAQCHNHKYDPFSQREFYALYAFFNQTQDSGSSEAPVISAPTEEQRVRRQALEERRETIRAELDAEDPEWEGAQARFEAEQRAARPAALVWRTLPAATARARHGTELLLASDGSVFATGPNPEREFLDVTVETTVRPLRALRLEARPGPDGTAGRSAGGNFLLGELHVLHQGRSIELSAARSDVEQEDGRFRAARAFDGDPATGWAVAPHQRREDLAAWFLLADPLDVPVGTRLRLQLDFDAPYGQHTLAHFRVSGCADPAVADWIRPARPGPWRVAGPFAADGDEEVLRRGFAPEAELWGAGTAADREPVRWQPREEWRDGRVHHLPGEHPATYLLRHYEAPEAREIRLLLGSGGALRVWWNSERVLERDGPRGVAPDQDRVTVRLRPGTNTLLLKVDHSAGASGFFFESCFEAGSMLPAAAEAALYREPSRRTVAEQRSLRRHFRERVSARGRGLSVEARDLEAKLAALEASVATVMVMREVEAPRVTRLLERGSFLAPGEEVDPGVPAVLNPWPEGAPRNRLGLARWLMAEDQPLVARVTVNRLWEQLFGVGLVATSEDFGTRGDPPSHPLLLDHLARSFQADGWSVKRLLRRIVLSSTYRQTSTVSAELRERDPANRLLARGPRLRMEAEMVRDHALAVSGLLSDARGGPSVFPPQPEGIWSMTYSDERWQTDEGPDRYRRGIYTFARRTAPYPTFAMFDAPSREVSCTRRGRSNTPLQALALLNDPAFMEAAGALAGRMRESGPDLRTRIVTGFRRCTGRPPTDHERTVLEELFCTERDAYVNRPDAARALLEAARAAPAPDDLAEQAAWVVVANTLLCLDETVTKG